LSQVTEEDNTSPRNTAYLEDTHSVKASSAAIDYIKQIIALASGVLALSATFITEFTSSGLFGYIMLAISWLLLFCSLTAGLWTMATIVKSRVDGNDDWSGGLGRRLAKVSRITFVGGLVIFAAFAFISFVQSNTPNHDAVDSLGRVTERKVKSAADTTIGPGSAYNCDTITGSLSNDKHGVKK